jgi:hypothetical protein
MKKLRFLLVLMVLPLLSISQTRYVDNIFTDVKVDSNVVYGSNVPFGSSVPIDLKCDIYQPLGDTIFNRPVIIFLHAGSFLPQSSIPTPGLGTKKDSAMVHLCKAFARKGYVTISATYRVGWNPLASTEEERARSIMSAVFRAQQDLKALIRYLNKEKNTWKIDPTRIAAGGSNSGGYVAIHAGCLNKPAELTYPKFLDGNNMPLIDTVALGNFEGNSGNPGYPSNHRVTISLGGAVGDTAFMEPGEPVILAMHGTADNTPYTTGVVIVNVTGQPVIEVHGGHDMVRRSFNLGNQAALLPDFANDNPFPGLYPFYGVGFEPYGIYANSTPGRIDTASKYLDTVITFLTPRLFKTLDLASWTSKEQTDLLSAFSNIYPNPARNEVFVTVDNSLPRIQTITFTDLTGRTLLSEEVNNYQTRLELGHLPKGIYFVTIKNQFSQVTKKLIIE